MQCYRPSTLATTTGTAFVNAAVINANAATNVNMAPTSVNTIPEVEPNRKKVTFDDRIHGDDSLPTSTMAVATAASDKVSANDTMATYVGLWPSASSGLSRGRCGKVG